MKDPAVLFYTQDFLTGTMLMNDEQKGKYITLLCLQHQNGGLTEKEMLKICGEFDEDIFKKFDLIEGKYYNKRMTLETNKRHNFIESRRKNLLHKEDDMDVHKEQLMENENENEIRNKKIEDRNELLNKREEKFRNDVYVFTNDPYPLVMLQKFCDYWTELNKSKTKMRWELEKTFEISKRLATWANRDKEFNKNTIDTPKTYEEMLKMAETDPDVFKRYKAVRREGERKAVFYPIEK
jgi:hypothetical protein